MSLPSCSHIAGGHVRPSNMLEHNKQLEHDGKCLWKDKEGKKHMNHRSRLKGPSGALGRSQLSLYNGTVIIPFSIYFPISVHLTERLFYAKKVADHPPLTHQSIQEHPFGTSLQRETNLLLTSHPNQQKGRKPYLAIGHTPLITSNSGYSPLVGKGNSQN